jgi:hypothetical protein
MQPQKSLLVFLPHPSPPAQSHLVMFQFKNQALWFLGYVELIFRTIFLKATGPTARVTKELKTFC